jgi:hypothetical protein
LNLQFGFWTLDLEFEFGIRICNFDLEFWIIWILQICQPNGYWILVLDLNMNFAVLLTKVVIGFWRFGFVLDFADMLTTMVIGFGVKFEHCLGLTNLKKFGSATVEWRVDWRIFAKVEIC